MFKPFLIALAVGFGLIYLYRGYQKQKNLAAVTYTDKNGSPVFAGPDIDPVTGTYTGPDARAGTIGPVNQQSQ